MVESPADPIKLCNLLNRRKVYGDITQNATEKQIEHLLVRMHTQYITIVFKR